MFNNICISNFLRLFIFNNSCAICSKKLRLLSDKLCLNCIKELKYSSSLKINNKNRVFLWFNRREYSRVARLSKNSRSSIFKVLDGIRGDKYENIHKDVDINFFEYS